MSKVLHLSQRGNRIGIASLAVFLVGLALSRLPTSPAFRYSFLIVGLE